MNDRDIDLVLALAEGRLSGPEARAAEAHVAADPELAAALEEQRLAIAAVSAAPAAEMTSVERARLRAALESGLGLTGGSAPAHSRPRRWLVPAASLAAVAAVAVAAFVVLPNAMGGGEEGPVALTRSTLDTDITNDAADDGGSTGGEEAAPRAPEDTRDTSTTAAAGDEAPEEAAAVPRVTTYDLEALEEHGAYVAEDGTLVPVDPDLVEECLHRDVPDATDVVIRAVSEDEGRMLVLVTFLNAVSGATGAAAVDPTACEVVEVSGG